MLLRVSFCFLVGIVFKLPAQERELRIGAAMAEEVTKRTKPLNSPAAQAFAQATADQLSPHIQPASSFPYRVSVIVEEESGSTREPFSLPGGYLFVPARLFLAAQDDAEFAAMMAHAMAHITLQRSFQPAVQRGQIPLIFMGGWVGYGGDGASTSLIPRGYFDTKRKEELAADRQAVAALADSGYDATALGRYLLRQQVDTGANSPLPAKTDRLAQLPPANAASPRPRPAFTAAQEEARRTLPTRQPPSLRRTGEAAR